MKKVGKCALCGENHPVTREHVPPKNLFLAPRPRNTITIPVCEECNHSYHLDDEYFRVYVAAGARPGTQLWRLWKEKVVGSSFVRSGGLKARLNEDRDLLQEHHKREPLQTFEGKLVADEWVPFLQPFDALRINAVVEKIVRCLHFHCTGSPLLSGIQVIVDVTPLSSADEQMLYDHRTDGVGHSDEFVFRHEFLGEHTSRWLLGFYRRHTFIVQATPTEPRRVGRHAPVARNVRRVERAS